MPYLFLPMGAAAQSAAGGGGAESPVRAVLVTGASSGIGRRIAETLAAEGIFEYASARRDADLNALDSVADVQSIHLDVTHAADIRSAVTTITAAGRGLYRRGARPIPPRGAAYTAAGRGLQGIVNSAGVVVAGPLIEVEESALDFIFGVDVHGALASRRPLPPCGGRRELSSSTAARSTESSPVR